MALSDIETIVFVMLENRSFDHMLGYLSLGAGPAAFPVDGLRDDGAWLSEFVNTWQGQQYRLHPLSASDQVVLDPPHRLRAHCNTDCHQGSRRRRHGRFRRKLHDPQAAAGRSLGRLGYYAADAVPIFDFFARHHMVCDHWFAALPSGTQANRLMAMGGQSAILDNASFLLPNQDLVYDWLNRHGIDWCAYQSGDFLPFFTLMPDWLPKITASLAFEPKGRFRRYRRFREHWMSTDPMPPVIFIEPEYTDGPHVDPNDDHPPTGIAKGQAFLSTSTRP